MRFKCRRCANEINLRLRDIYKNDSFVCEECKKIEIWQNESRHNRRIKPIDNYKKRYDKSEYKLGLYDEMNHIFSGKTCAYQFQEDEWPFMDKVLNVAENGYITFEKNGTIPVCDINVMEVVEGKENKYIYNQQPVYGFKGVKDNDGILGDGLLKNVYEINVPNVTERLNPLSTNYQNAYFHFCKNIFDVLYIWNRDYINTSLPNFEGTKTRLFCVKAEDHVFQNTEHGWVANKITLLFEVPKAFIIDCFEDGGSYKFIGESSLLGTDVWDCYKNCIETKYTPFLSIEDINHLFDKYLKYSYDYNTDDIERLIFDNTYGFRFRSNYSYLRCRYNILNNRFNENDEWLNYLKINEKPFVVDKLNDIWKYKEHILFGYPEEKRLLDSLRKTW